MPNNPTDVNKSIYELPFEPFDKPLKEVLFEKYIIGVAKWLLGDKSSSDLVAMGASSVWETGLSILYLMEVDEINKKEGKKLIDIKKNKIENAVSWLLSEKNECDIFEKNDGYNWDKVTWDTSVVVRALVVVLERYGEDFNHRRKEIEIATEKGVRWLYHMFVNWDKEVKYPFGPADLAQILSTLLLIQQKHPKIYEKICREFKQDEKNLDVASDIVIKLLGTKTTSSKIFDTKDLDGKEAITCYYWDDFFSTAEVVEALAYYYKYCKNTEKDPNLQQHLIINTEKTKQTLNDVREALIRTCNYFETEQVDGMWGNHIDTIKVIYAYVRIQDCIYKNEKNQKEQIITPEIHIAFKAIRWICDEKQIFKDKNENDKISFMHTMYLTVFYAQALLEIYKYWDAAKYQIGKLYDDVVWFSPMRTTPERARRLALELKYIELEEEKEQTIKNLTEKIEELKLSIKVRQRWLTMGLLSSCALTIAFVIGRATKNIELHANVAGVFDKSSSDYFAIVLGLITAAVAISLNFNQIFKKD